MALNTGDLSRYFLKYQGSTSASPVGPKPLIRLKRKRRKKKRTSRTRTRKGNPRPPAAPPVSLAQMPGQKTHKEKKTHTLNLLVSPPSFRPLSGEKEPPPLRCWDRRCADCCVSQRRTKSSVFHTFLICLPCSFPSGVRQGGEQNQECCSPFSR